VEEVGKFIGVDSLEYLSLEGMLDAVAGGENKFCTACFNGVYPTKTHKKTKKCVLEK